MMRKMLVFALVFLMVAIFAACKDSNDEQTTLNPLNTAYSPVSTSSSSVQNVSQQPGTGATYILTTNQNKTVPALNTTRFNINVAATVPSQTLTSTTNNYNNISYTTNGTIAMPSVNTTGAQTTTWQTIASTTGSTTNSGTTKNTTRPTTTQPTTKAEPMPVSVVINDTFIDSDGRICATVDSSGWGGKIKSNSQRVSISIDGVEMEEKVTLQISSATTGDGYQYVYLKLSDYEIDVSSSTVSFVIPEGFLENKTGTKYNSACEVTM